MEIFDEQGNLIENPDLDLGYLETRTRTVHHDAVEAVEEVSHYEVIAEYPNGGKDVRKVIDVPGVEPADAYDEEIRYRIYIPYTETELAAINEPNGSSDINTLQEKINELTSQNEMLLECLMEISEIVYS